MAYNVDFWYLSQDACEIRTDFTPFSEHEEESIYMKTSDFFEMIEKFTNPDLERKAKAFDEIVNIEDDFVKYHGFSLSAEEYAKEVKEIVSEYLEDE